MADSQLTNQRDDRKKQHCLSALSLEAHWLGEQFSMGQLLTAALESSKRALHFLWERFCKFFWCDTTRSTQVLTTRDANIRGDEYRSRAEGRGFSRARASAVDVGQDAIPSGEAAHPRSLEGDSVDNAVQFLLPFIRSYCKQAVYTWIDKVFVSTKCVASIA